MSQCVPTATSCLEAEAPESTTGDADAADADGFAEDASTEAMPPSMNVGPLCGFANLTCPAPLPLLSHIVSPHAQLLTSSMADDTFHIGFLGSDVKIMTNRLVSWPSVAPSNVSRVFLERDALSKFVAPPRSALSSTAFKVRPP
eukprot:3997084-Pleurochrysis_carterae.AAC.1